MKLLVVGLGQCGNRIADEFVRLNKRAIKNRGFEIITDVFAVNTDAADLTGLRDVKSNYQHRILIGGRETGGHGVGKLNEVGAEIAREDGDKIINSIRTSKRFYETDAILLVAGAAGGTGSGSIPIVARLLKERYYDKSLYCLLVLPFEHETSEERAIYNAAVCMKSVRSIASAVILFDNQRYIRKDYSLSTNLAKINTLIVEPFYNLLCAGEEEKGKYIGAKVLDSGDIIQTLKGWTVIGYGRSLLPLIHLPFNNSKNFKKKGTETHKGIYAIDEAMAELSIKCNTGDANRALYLISAPAGEMNMDLIKELGNYLKELAPRAIIRNGDYPRRRGQIDITLIFSDLDDVEKVRDYYNRSIRFLNNTGNRQDRILDKLNIMDEMGRDVPTLL